MAAKFESCKSAKVELDDCKAEKKLKYLVFSRQNRNQVVPFFSLSLLGGKYATSGYEFRGFDTLYLHKYPYRKCAQVCQKHLTLEMVFPTGFYKDQEFFPC